MTRAAPAAAAAIAIPRESPERAFLEYWAAHLLDPRDPQNARWLALEQGQIARGRRLAAELARFAPLPGARALDVGCQTGALTIALAAAGARATGVDVSAELVRAAEIRAGCHGVAPDFRVARAEALPFADASFDLVAFVDVIEHVDDAARALAEAARVLRPDGGVLYVQGPNRLSPRWLLRDPHYQMAGISVLPPALGRFYVTRVRRRPRYDVGVFPVGSRVARTLARLGFALLESPYDPRASLARRAAGAMRLRFGSMFTLVAARSREPSRRGSRFRAPGGFG